jgi:hypothetical protein
MELPATALIQGGAPDSRFFCSLLEARGARGIVGLKAKGTKYTVPGIESRRLLYCFQIE